jgi:hypothetical protein
VGGRVRCSMPVFGGVVLREYEITDGSPTTSGTGDHVYGLGRRLVPELSYGQAFSGRKLI